MPPRPSPRAQAGFTLIEVMAAALVLVTGVLGALTLLDGATRATQATKSRDTANSLAREMVEGARSVGYPNLDVARFTSTLQTSGGLADDSGAAGWQVRRQGVEFTITPSICTFDDARDGGGAQGAGYCTGGATAGTTDPNPDDYRRVSLLLSWKTGGRTLQIRQSALVNNPGSAFAPSVTQLKMTAPATVIPPALATICDPNVTTASFNATTSAKPSAMVWAVDDVVDETLANQSGANTSWNWTWALRPNNVPLLDGDYVISARAINDAGTAGTERAMTVKLNRYAPSAPTGFTGGQNPAFRVFGEEVGANEFEWTRNPERDIVGYRLYRVQGSVDGGGTGESNDVLVGSTNSPDKTELELTPMQAGSYYVRAQAPARSPCPTTSMEEGANSAVKVVDATNLAPQPITNLVGTRQGQTVTLTWSAPAPPNPAGEAGDTLRYYRVYRDGLDWTDRLDHTGAGTDVTFTDREAGPGTRRYWVTSVDEHLRESAPVALEEPL